MYLTVKNWSEFQHYKDRNPPWIKLHRTLLDDYEFACLQDASKLHLMLIWLLASQSEGRIPNDPKFLAGKLGLKSAPDLQPLISSGFLIPEQNASAALALDASEVRLETEAYKASEKSVCAPTSGKKKGKSLIPSGFGISDQIRAWAKKEGLDQHLEAHLAYFIDWATANAKQYADWDATFRNAVRGDWGDVRKNLALSAKTGIQAAGRQWWETANGIESKGKELGLDRQPDEQFPFYKQRVFSQAGEGPWMNR